MGDRLYVVTGFACPMCDGAGRVGWFRCRWCRPSRRELRKRERWARAYARMWGWQ